MNLLAWNCHGLGTPCAFGALRKLLLSEVPDVVFLMETRKLDSELQAQRGLAGYNNVFAVSCSGIGRRKTGGLGLLWKDTIDVQVQHFSINHISFVFTLDDGGVSHVTALYGFPQAGQKHKTWSLIRSLKPADGVHWLCVGDYNQIMAPEDKRGGNHPNLQLINGLRDVLDEVGLSELDIDDLIF